MKSQIVPFAGNLHVPAHVRRKHPSGEIRIVRRMVIGANPAKRQVLLSFPDAGIGYIIPSAASLRRFIEQLTALEVELFDERGKNMANALHKDDLDFAQKTS